jgi:succinyl-diaminopimelate desuccinylase
MKDTLLGWVERDREALIDFLREFVRCRSPNPPGDTVEAADFVRRTFKARGIELEEIAPVADRPNFIASFDTGRPGPHLVARISC